MNVSSRRNRVSWRRAVVAAFVALAVGAASAGQENGPDVSTDEALRGLQRWLDGTRDLQAEFEQTLVSGALGAGTSESGKLYMERPGRLRWDYTHPESKTAILIGDRTFLYLAEDRQLIRGHLSADQASLPGLLAGSGKIADAFDAAMISPAGSGKAAAKRIRLVPRRRPDGFSEVVLTVLPPDFAIEAAEVTDAAGNRTSYRFRSVRRNRGVPAGTFAFEPPPGTEITDQP